MSIELPTCNYLNITAVADFFMEIKLGGHGKVTLRGYLARMPDIRRLQEEAVRITVQEDGDNREQYCSGGLSRVCTRLWRTGCVR